MSATFLELRTLAEIASNDRFAIVDGPFGTQLHAAEYRVVGVPVIRVVNTSFEGHFLSDQLVFIAESKARQLERSEVRPGDIIIAKTGATIGKSGVFPPDWPRGIIASSCIKITVDRSKADNRFVSYLIQSAEGQRKIIDGAGGSTRTTINTKPFGAIAFKFPPRPEQTKIAEVLSTVDRAIEQTEGLIAKHQRIKIGLMQDLLTRGIDEHGNLRSEQTHKFKDSPLGRIPVEWEVKPLGDISIGGAQNGFFKKPELVGSGYKLINVSELYQPFGINAEHSDVERVNATSEDLHKYGVVPGDIFFTRSSLVLGGIAHCNIIREVAEPTLFECHVMRIRTDANQVVPEFVALFCRSHIARLFLMSRAKHVTMATISQPELEDLLVPVPPILDEQFAIVQGVLASEQTIRCYEERKTKLRSLKTALMQDLLSGKVRVTPLLSKPEEAGA